MGDLQSTSILQETLKFALASLEIGVATNVLLLDIDIWDRALAIDLFQRSLDGGSIIYSPVSSFSHRLDYDKIWKGGNIPT